MKFQFPSPWDSHEHDLPTPPELPDIEQLEREHAEIVEAQQRQANQLREHESRITVLEGVAGVVAARVRKAKRQPNPEDRPLPSPTSPPLTRIRNRLPFGGSRKSDSPGSPRK